MSNRSPKPYAPQEITTSSALVGWVILCVGLVVGGVVGFWFHGFLQLHY